VSTSLEHEHCATKNRTRLLRFHTAVTVDASYSICLKVLNSLHMDVNINKQIIYYIMKEYVP